MLDTDERKRLETLHDRVQLCEAETAAAKAQLELHVAKMFSKHGGIKGRDGLCLTCGALFLARQGCSCARD
jgi:hypothetical protein